MSATKRIERSFTLRGDECFRKEHLVKLDLSIELEDFTNKDEPRCWSRGMLWPVICHPTSARCEYTGLLVLELSTFSSGNRKLPALE